MCKSLTHTYRRFGTESVDASLMELIKTLSRWNGIVNMITISISSVCVYLGYFNLFWMMYIRRWNVIVIYRLTEEFRLLNPVGAVSVVPIQCLWSMFISRWTAFITSRLISNFWLLLHSLKFLLFNILFFYLIFCWLCIHHFFFFVNFTLQFRKKLKR